MHQEWYNDVLKDERLLTLPFSVFPFDLPDIFRGSKGNIENKRVKKKDNVNKTAPILLRFVSS